MVLINGDDMLITENHPDFSLYSRIQRASADCLTIIQQWRDAETIVEVPAYGLQWSPQSATIFFRALSTMLVEYNQVLWDGFQYCQLCKGKCCTDGVIEAAEVYDYLALALLNEHLPVLAEQIDTTENTCIYLDGARCTWSQSWRLYKCWSYYCLGPSSVWQNMQDGKHLDQRYQELHQALIPVINANLPAALKLYEQRHKLNFADAAISPTALAWHLHRGINEVFVFPLSIAYPELQAVLKPHEQEEVVIQQSINYSVKSAQ